MSVKKDGIVSIIVPVFNVENYLRQCIESILNQSYKSIQLILINDGSTDSSGEICDEYAARDNRCLCVHKPNGGISSARNAGLELAQGEYICFVDSDDYIDCDFIETLVTNIYQFDVVACGTKTFNANGNFLKKSSVSNGTYIGNEIIKSAYMDDVICHNFYVPYSKLYKASVLNNIVFDTNLKVGEDIVFNINYLKNCDSAKTIIYHGYNIRSNQNSTTHKLALKYTPLYEHDYLIIQNGIRDARREWGFSEDYLTSNWESSCPMRYYHEITNLFRVGTPYSKKTIRQKIKIINSDKKFIRAILKQPFKKLSSAEKFSWLSAFLRLPLISYMLFYSVMKLRKEI